MMRTTNPALNDAAFTGFGRAVAVRESMTIQGTANKALALLLLLILSAAWTWRLYYTPEGQQALVPWMLGGVFGGLLVAIILAFKKTWAPVLAPAYALLEGLALGGISSVLEGKYPGIVIQAVGLKTGR